MQHPARRSLPALCALVLLCACQPDAPPPAGNQATPGSTANVAADNAIPESPPLPPPATELADPASPLAAVAVVQRYHALLAQGQDDEAATSWSDSGPDGSAAYARQIGDHGPIRAIVGPPGMPEGAAGSIYIEIPVTIEGRDGFRLARIATLRRVNDVPGSTAQQRRWHIVSIAPATAGAGAQ